jgi:hypothetical protein
MAAVFLCSKENEKYTDLLFSDRERLHHKGAINTASSANIVTVGTRGP